MTLHFLFQLVVLGEKALVPRCVIVWEELGQEKVHIRPWLASWVAHLSGCVVVGCMHMGKVLYVDVVARAFRLHA